MGRLVSLRSAAPPTRPPLGGERDRAEQTTIVQLPDPTPTALTVEGTLGPSRLTEGPLVRTPSPGPRDPTHLQHPMFGLLHGGGRVLRLVLDHLLQHELKGVGGVLHQLGGAEALAGGWVRPTDTRTHGHTDTRTHGHTDNHSPGHLTDT